MATESLIVNLYREVSKTSKDYCSICFRTSKERRLLDGKNLTKFQLFQYNSLKGNIDTCSNQKICYICDAQAAAAHKFCLAVNISQHIQDLFTKMSKQPSFAMQVMNHLTHVGTQQPELWHKDRKVKTLQTMLEQLRRKTTLLQTETLLLNNPGKECIVETSSAPGAGGRDRESFRDLLTFESQPDIDEALFDFDASEIDNKQIIIENDDPIIKEEPPDQNVFIIPDRLPSEAATTDTLTTTTTGYLLHPIVVNNGKITIPSLDKNISIDNPNLNVNGIGNNTNNTPSYAPLDKFIVTPSYLSQTTSKTQIVTSNVNQNKTNLNIIQNTNSLAKNIVSMIKNPCSGQNKEILGQNKRIFAQNIPNLSQNTVCLEQTTGNLQNTSIRQQMLKPMSTVMANLSNIVPQLTPVKTIARVKVSASPAVVKRPDSDGDNCHTIQPIRKPGGKIDWEDKIPMDVISFVSPSDPTTAKRQKISSSLDASGHLTTMDDDDRPTSMGIITDVKSVREPEVIDLC